MPRVTFVKAAQKDYPAAGIKKGQSYYWWKFRFGGKHMQLTQPDRRQLTQSDFQIAIYDFEDSLAGLVADESLDSQIESIADDMDSLADEQEEKLSNMPNGLQEGEVGQMLQERSDALREWGDELRGIDTDLELAETLDDFKEQAAEELALSFPVRSAEDQAQVDAKAQELLADAEEEKKREIMDEAQGTSYGGP